MHNLLGDHSFSLIKNLSPKISLKILRILNLLFQVFLLIKVSLV